MKRGGVTMATIFNNGNIKIVRYNNASSFDIAIVDKDDNEITILHEDVKFLLNTIINILLDEYQ